MVLNKSYIVQLMVKQQYNDKALLEDKFFVSHSVLKFEEINKFVLFLYVLGQSI